MKFVVIYRVPVETMQDWMKNTPPEEMAAQGKKLGEDMMAWSAKNKASIIDNGLPLGKNTRMTAVAGGEPTAEAISNDLQYYCVVEAEKVEDVVAMFKDNPHFMIPTSFLDIMAVTHTGM